NSGPSTMAAVRVTGQSWCLYTTSVVRVLEWPTASAICSMHRAAEAGAEHQVVLLPGRTGLRPVGRLRQDQFPQRRYGDLGDLEHPPRLLGLSLPGAPYRSVDGHGAGLKVHFGPAQGPGLLRCGCRRARSRRRMAI